MKMNDDLSAEFVRSALRYEDATGHLYWRSRSDIPERINKRMVGRLAGCRAFKDRGYWVIGINGKTYLAHRLVWLIVTGEWPVGVLDHEDEDTLNNRFSNLRPANQSKNMGNRGKQRNNTSGFKGVYLDTVTGRWVANICHNKKTIYLGRHSSRESAAIAYDEAARRIFGEFAKLNFPANDNKDAEGLQ